MAKVMSEPDDASAGRRFRKGEKGMPEQLGSAIRVDGKPLKADRTAIVAEMKPVRAEAKMADDESSEPSRTNAMGDTYKKGGAVRSASKRGDGIAQRGKTRGTLVMCGGGKV